MSQVKHLVSAAVLAAVALCAAIPAGATVILTMGQSVGGTTIVGTNNGLGSTTITGTDIPITVTQFILGGTPFAAFLNITATNTVPGNAMKSGSNVTQEFGGSFEITSAKGGGGTDFLSGTFTDSIFGAGASLTLSAAEPPNSANFKSSVIPIADLGLARGISLSFAGVTPAANVTKGSLSTFKSSVSGTFSANVPTQVPEPGSLLLVGLAMLALVVLLRRSTR
jgi:hypothetical protein